MGKAWSKRKVVDGKLQCIRCDEWKPIEEFRNIKAQDYYNSWCRACEGQKNKDYRQKRCKIQPDYDREYYQQNKERIGARVRMRTWSLKLEVIAAYGGKCACCGETRPQFLSVDHIYNDGAKDRGNLRKGAGRACYAKLRREGFPKDRYQLLCMNCNCAKFWYGICPHETERMEAQSGRT